MTKGRGFSPTHCELWHCCEQMAERAKEVERGAFYFDLSQMVFAFFSYEAYLNFVGGLIAPNEWAEERKFFRREPYQGIKGKFRLLEEKLGLTVDRSTDPYSTVAGLEQLRDFISHGKSENYTVTTAALRRDEDFPFSGSLSQWVTPTNATHAKAQVFELCHIIHERAKSTDRLKKDRRFGVGPFSAHEEVEWVP